MLSRSVRRLADVRIATLRACSLQRPWEPAFTLTEGSSFDAAAGRRVSVFWGGGLSMLTPVVGIARHHA
jgi:hypothetical protein